jgi:hypothetical protein
MAVQTVIKLRRDTAANWASVNPTLASGEEGLETDTGKKKIGNGTSAWNSLSYSNPGGAIPQSQVTNLTSDLSAKAPASSPTFSGTITTPLTTAGYVKTNSSGVLSSSAAISQSDVTNLTSDLAGKASSSHTHGMTDLTEFTITSATSGQILTYNGTKWVNAAAPASGFDPFMLMGA